tara:strand:+ start:3387 stop:3497 length:111 start_codon:yes stop_codon:yes gene_type:complete
MPLLISLIFLKKNLFAFAKQVKKSSLAKFIKRLQVG